MSTFEIDPSQAALILIDFQNDVVGKPGGRFRTLLEERGVLTNAARIAVACRKISVPVILIRAERDPKQRDQVDKITEPIAAGKAPRQSELNRVVPGTEGWEFVDELTPGPDDIVIAKHRVSAFSDTPLETYLRALGRRTLLIGGVYTHRGVESTVRSAWDLDYQIVVLTDCCAASDLHHTHAVEHIFPEFGRVATADEALRALGAA